MTESLRTTGQDLVAQLSLEDFEESLSRPGPMINSMLETVISHREDVEQMEMALKEAQRRVGLGQKAKKADSMTRNDFDTWILLHEVEATPQKLDIWFKHVIRIDFDLNLADVIEPNQLIAAIPVEMDRIIISAILKAAGFSF
jgi:hypothetical protein